LPLVDQHRHRRAQQAVEVGFRDGALVGVIELVDGRGSL
jgi:hypothetical protein